MASNLFRLTVRRGPEEGQSFTLSENSVTVGRDPMADIILKDPEVSRQHARFIRTDEGYQVQDLGSTNGTFVEGRRLSGEAMSLDPGTVITMGSNVTLVFEATQDPAATVISPESGFDFESGDFEEVEPDVAEETPLAEEAEAARIYDMPEAEPVQADEPALPDDDATAFDFPAEEEVQDVVGKEVDELLSFDSGYEEMDDQKTVLDMEAEPISAYGYEGDEDEGELPSFDADDDYELPSFEAEPERAYEAEGAYTPDPQSIDRTPPPPPPPAPPEKEGRNRNVIIAAVIVLLLLCCCCLLIWLAWTYGDAFINMSGIQIQ